jgi:hypothetical protein
VVEQVEEACWARSPPMAARNGWMIAGHTGTVVEGESETGCRAPEPSRKPRGPHLFTDTRQG